LNGRERTCLDSKQSWCHPPALAALLLQPLTWTSWWRCWSCCCRRRSGSLERAACCSSHSRRWRGPRLHDADLKTRNHARSGP